MDTDGSPSARAALVAALDIVDAAPTERLERIVRIARDLFAVPMSYVNLLDDALLHTLTPNVPGEATTVPLEWSFCQLTVQRPGPTVVPDTAADPRTADLPGVTSRGIRFYAGVPPDHAGRRRHRDPVLDGRRAAGVQPPRTKRPSSTSVTGPSGPWPWASSTTGCSRSSKPSLRSPWTCRATVSPASACRTATSAGTYTTGLRATTP
ncbi:GAF domain-containing protein [Curtobacterium sp. MCJR17_043]|uniref:GAF domain-containing protein n=1 Tax=Curtobacterium sp. MCJR17_043 TaxID=2175660 RepID=UPI0024DF861D|nr:GAF domain-containing protein [Curtobacterium sp. MCJR17_043]WIB36152.1 GAF domain-containing protein [Curtobacterium sp. MCJR17_043]